MFLYVRLFVTLHRTSDKGFVILMFMFVIFNQSFDLFCKYKICTMAHKAAAFL